MENTGIMSEVKEKYNWTDVIEPFFETEEGIKLKEFIEKEYSNKEIYPNKELIFRAFDLCPFEKLKVVILGMDPYHTPGAANGLAFAINKGCKIQPSLANILAEVKRDTGELNTDSTLEKWAIQGVLLLNTSLTVIKGEPGSHIPQWRKFTENIISFINTNKTTPVVFLLWGNHALSFLSHINLLNHYVIEAGHPSPLNTKNPFKNSKIFSKTNNILKNEQDYPIKW